MISSWALSQSDESPQMMMNCFLFIFGPWSATDHFCSKTSIGSFSFCPVPAEMFTHCTHTSPINFFFQPSTFLEHSYTCTINLIDNIYYPFNFPKWSAYQLQKKKKFYSTIIFTVLYGTLYHVIIQSRPTCKNNIYTCMYVVTSQSCGHRYYYCYQAIS